MAKIKIAGTALVAAALVAGCSKNETTEVATDATTPDVAAAPAEDPNEVVVSIGEKNLTRGEVAKMVDAAIAKDGDKIPAEQLAYPKSPKARPSPSWAPAAPASPPSWTSSPASTTPPPAASPSTAPTSATSASATSAP